MKKYVLFLIPFCLFGVSVKSQNDNISLLTTLFKSQKQYITDSIQEKQQSKYLTVLHFANVIRPKVISEIQKINASFPANDQNINIVEGFAGYINISGVIWQGDSTYYSYSYGADKKLIVIQRSLSQLSDTTRIIVQNFANWSNTAFAINGQALGSPTDHPFFLASKVLNISERIKTVGFYFQ